jgi:proteasome lid subunit RPN8/RPN11
MSEARFGSWSAAESPVTIEYSLVVIEEIRHEVAEGVQKLSRGGVEVGGLLYGTRDGRTVRLMAMRPIVCEHARGPAFQLSDSDRGILEEQIEHAPEDPRLADLICLGWFVSHTRSEITLSETDLEIYERYFSAPWQVTMVVRPGRAGAMRAGFFVREHDGTIRRESSYMEFNFPDRLAGVLDRPARTDRQAPSRAHTVYFRETAAAPTQQESAQALAHIPGPQLLPAQPPRSKWPWLAAWGGAVLITAVLGMRYIVLTPAPQPLELSVFDRNGQLQVEWNPEARAVLSSVRGSLIVTDGPTPRSILLKQDDLRRGSFSYQRVTDDVEVRMTVQDAAGEEVDSKTTTFLGTAPTKAADDEKIKAIEKERDDLKAEVNRLKGNNAQQAEQILQLQRNLKVLQSRLGIE